MINNVVTKAEFAALTNLSRARVTQLVGEGKLDGCLVGEGRKAMIDVAKAMDALKIRRDAGQMLGNGAKTRTDLPSAGREPPARSEADVLDLRLKQERLAQAEATNRKLREEERARRGIYCLADDARLAGARTAAKILQMVEGGMADTAAKLAAQHKLPPRDVVHFMRAEFRRLRAAIAENLGEAASALPDNVEDKSTLDA